MDIESVLQVIQSRLRNPDQKNRIKQLAERIQTALDKARAKGVQAELEKDWVKLKTEFDQALKAVQKQTGLY